MRRKLLLFFGLMLMLATLLWQEPVPAAGEEPEIVFSFDREGPASVKKMTVTVRASEGIESIKYQTGVRYESYFAKRGKVMAVNGLYESSRTFTMKKNAAYTFYVLTKDGTEKVETIEITDIDREAPHVVLTEERVGEDSLQPVSFITVEATDNNEIADLRYVAGALTDPADPLWDSAEAYEIGGSRVFTVAPKKAGTFSVRALDPAGNAMIRTITVVYELPPEEKRAVWITYLELSDEGYTEEAFRERVRKMFDSALANRMNTVIFQVRPFSDALYRSDYYPWSVYVSGTQGVDPGFDPFAIAVEEAHARGLAIEAYLNPYRICRKTDFKKLAENSPAYQWLHDDNEDNDRNVLLFNSMYYYNPASRDVVDLIVAGVREILQKYDVDGVVFDDYFYPTLGKNYQKNFDAPEYETYCMIEEAAGEEPLSIADWRRQNISGMVHQVWRTVHTYGNDIPFGISPAGNLNNLRSDLQHYVDIDLWCNTPGYVDYVSPQQYWGFESTACAFIENIENWVAVVRSPDVKLYVTLPAHYAVTQPTKEWKENHDVLMRMVTYLRAIDKVDGFYLFRQDFLDDIYLKTDELHEELNNLLSILVE